MATAVLAAGFFAGAFGLLLQWYLFIAIIYAFYCWVRKADRTGTKFRRRLHAVLLGFSWPVHLVQALQRRRAGGQAETPRRAGSANVPPAGHVSTVPSSRVPSPEAAALAQQYGRSNVDMDVLPSTTETPGS